MGIFEKLPNKLELEDYIVSYAGYENTTSAHSQASLQELMRFWDEAKSLYLYDLLGRNYILEKEVEFDKPIGDIKNKISESCNIGVMRDFYDNFYEWIIDRYANSKKGAEDFDERVLLMDLLSPLALAEGKVTTYSKAKIELKGGSAVAIQCGAKPIRILSKIARIEEIDGFEDFRLELSRILNTKKVKGTLCLSIHPLDYLTMSDNPYGWDSCMNWMNEGQYRMGTVEMMNSKNVIIAYMKGEKPLRFYDDEWNGKKWRNLFITTEKFITGIKGYPYQSSEFDIKVLDWLKELAKENLGWEYGDAIEYTPDDAEGYIHNGDADIYHDFQTNIMYNDFGNNNTTHIVLAPEIANGGAIQCHYSGVPECMYCGEELCSTSDIDSEGCVICLDCLAAYTCDCCGDRVYSSDSLYELDGEYLCESCYNDKYVEDYFTDEGHNVENCTRTFLISENPHEGDDLALWRLKDIYCHVYTDTSEYFNDTHIYSWKSGFWTERIDYITPNDLTEKGWAYFKESDFVSLGEALRN